MRTSLTRRPAGLVFAVVITLLTVLSAPVAHAATYESWGRTDPYDGDAGGSSVYVELRNPDAPPDVQAAYYAEFRAYGETLNVDDNEPDGHEVKALLTVEGEGTAAFWGVDFHDLSFAEGKSYSLQVCIDGTSVCSDTYYGTT